MSRRVWATVAGCMTIFLVSIGGIFISYRAGAAAVTWDGGGATENWNDCDNWSGNVCPNTSGTATFDATSTKNVTVNAAINVRGIDMNVGYTGVITQAAAITLGSDGFAQDAGYFNGASQAIDVNGPFTLAGGIFTATTGTLSVSGAWTHTAGGTFAHSDGTVTFDGAAATIDVTVDEYFYNLIWNSTGIKTVAAGDTLVATGDLSLLNGSLNTGDVNAEGDVTHDVAFDGGTGMLIISGPIAFSVESGTLPGIRMNHVSATFTGPIAGETVTIGGDVDIAFGTFTSGEGTLSVMGDWTLAPGASFVHGSGTVEFVDASHAFVGSSTFYNFSFSSISQSRAIIFEAGSTTTIVNRAFMGVDATYPTGTQLELASDVPGVRAFIDVQGVGVALRSFSDLSVTDIEATDGTDIQCRVRCVDGGNTEGWYFGDPGVLVSAVSGDTSEAGAVATFTVVLRNAPLSSAAIGVTSSDLTEGSVSPALLTFTAGNWDTPQTVTVTGVNDTDDDGAVTYTAVLAVVSSADSNYSGLNPPDVTVVNTDDDLLVGSFDFDDTADYSQEDVKDTGTSPITWFEVLYYGHGILKTGSGGAAVNIGASKIEPGCVVTIDGGDYTILAVPNAGAGEITIAEQPSGDPYALEGELTPGGAVTAIVCGDIDGAAYTLHDESWVSTRNIAVSNQRSIVYDAENDALWADYEESVHKIDLGDDSVTSFSRDTTTATGLAIDPTRQRIWAINSDSITAFDTLTGAYAFGTFMNSTFTVGVNPSDVVYDATNDAIWVLSSGDDVTPIAELTKLDAADGALIASLAQDEEVGAYSTRGLAYDAVNDVIWAVMNDGISIMKVDAATALPFTGSQVTSMYALQFPGYDFASAGSVAYDEINDVVWVGNAQCDPGYEDFVAKVRASDGLVLGNYPVPTCPISLVLDGERLFVSNDYTGMFAELRTSDGTRIEDHTGEDAMYGLALDGDGDLWTGRYDDKIFEYIEDGNPAEQYYTVVSTDAGQYDVTSVTEIASSSVTEVLEGQTISYAFSFNDRNSYKAFVAGAWRVIASNLAADHGGVDGMWYYRDGGNVWTATTSTTPNIVVSLAIAASSANRMTGTALAALTADDWSTTGGFIAATSATLDIAATAYTASVRTAPSVAGVALTFTVADEGGEEEEEEGGGGGGGSASVYPSSLSVDAPSCSATRSVALTVGAENVSWIVVSTDGIFDTEVWVPFVNNTQIGATPQMMTLSATLPAANGVHGVSVRFRSSTGEVSNALSAIVTLDTLTACAEDPTESSVIVETDTTETSVTVTDAVTTDDATAESSDVTTSGDTVIADTGAGSTELSEIVGCDGIRRPGHADPAVTGQGPSPVTGLTENINEVFPGDYVRSYSFTTVYCIMEDLTRRPFIDEVSYFTHELSFQGITWVTDATLATLTIGPAMLPNVGKSLVKFPSDPAVYVVGPHESDDTKLLFRKLANEEVATESYGADWAEYVIDFNETLRDSVIIGAPIETKALEDTTEFRPRALLNENSATVVPDNRTLLSIVNSIRDFVAQTGAFIGRGIASTVRAIW